MVVPRFSRSSSECFGDALDDGGLQALGNFVDQQQFGRSISARARMQHLLLAAGQRSGLLRQPVRRNGK